MWKTVQLARVLHRASWPILAQARTGFATPPIFPRERGRGTWVVGDALVGRAQRCYWHSRPPRESRGRPAGRRSQVGLGGRCVAIDVCWRRWLMRMATMIVMMFTMTVPITMIVCDGYDYVVVDVDCDGDFVRRTMYDG